jgi:HPt (histidine-containing phosphotransfer) domain-containing protein
VNKKGDPVDAENSTDRSVQHEVALLEESMLKQMDRPLEPAVNFPDLLTRVGNDRELICELFEMFKEEFPGRQQSLQESVRCAQMKDVEKVSHTLKGMLSSLSVTRAAAAAARLEQIGRDQEISRLGDALTNFEYEVANLLSELDAYLAGAQP